MASYKIRTAGNCPAVLFTIWSPFNIRIGRGNSLPIRLLQAGHSSLPLRKLESDAEGRCRHRCCRRNRFPSRQRRTESDAEGRCSDGRSWRAILHRHDDYAASIRKSGPEIKNRCTHESINRQNLASIRKSGPEIRNQCTQEGLNGKNLHRFASSGLKSRIDARKWP